MTPAAGTVRGFRRADRSSAERHLRRSHAPARGRTTSVEPQEVTA
jgi:hypothetical protein